MNKDCVSVAITGSGGAGAITAGRLLLEAAGRYGWHGLMTRSVGPQIRGGEAASMLRLAGFEVVSHADRFDLLVALDWKNVERFAAEIPLDADSLVLADADAGPLPPAIARAGSRQATLPFQQIAGSIEGGRANTVALGAVGALIGLDLHFLADVIGAGLARKGAQEEAVTQALQAGYDAVAAAGLTAKQLTPVKSTDHPRWLISGNQAAALGALRAGVRFSAVYPITPATDMLEWLAPRLKKLGGMIEQAEDEIAAISMALGASHGGVPAMTATSGPGLALMAESIGLAVAAEVPVLIIDVMRGGPSTGIPTKSEQVDLDIALHGLHGDAPHLVLAANSVADCAFTTQWAVELAETLQSPAIMLSDQFLGQAINVIPPIRESGHRARRLILDAPTSGYQRYALTESGVSPMALPGLAGAEYTADGLEHDQRGTPSSRADDHLAQLDKRQHKLDRHAYGEAWAEIDGPGEGDIAVVTWGSITGAVREAVQALRDEGWKLRLISIRLLAPAQIEPWSAAIAGCNRLLVVEQSHSGQFLRYLKANLPLPGDIATVSRPGPLPIRPGEIRAALNAWS